MDWAATVAGRSNILNKYKNNKKRLRLSQLLDIFVHNDLNVEEMGTVNGTEIYKLLKTEQKTGPSNSSVKSL